MESRHDLDSKLMGRASSSWYTMRKWTLVCALLLTAACHEAVQEQGHPPSTRRGISILAARPDAIDVLGVEVCDNAYSVDVSSAAPVTFDSGAVFLNGPATLTARGNTFEWDGETIRQTVGSGAPRKPAQTFTVLCDGQVEDAIAAL